MTTSLFQRQSIARYVLLALVIASLVFTLRDTVRAADDEGTYQNSITQIQICRAMGGTAEVTVIRRGSTFFTEVICRGGFMDGFTCIHANGEAMCRWESVRVQPEIVLPDTSELLPLETQDEVVTEPSPVIIETPDEVDIVAPEPTATPEPTADVIIQDPIVVEPPVDEGEQGDDPVVDDGAVVENPEVSDEPVDDSNSSGGKPGLPEPQVDPGDILPMEEPVILL